jgi:hypothetical protein
MRVGVVRRARSSEITPKTKTAARRMTPLPPIRSLELKHTQTHTDTHRHTQTHTQTHTHTHTHTHTNNTHACGGRWMVHEYLTNSSFKSSVGLFQVRIRNDGTHRSDALLSCTSSSLARRPLRLLSRRMLSNRHRRWRPHRLAGNASGRRSAQRQMMS